MNDRELLELAAKAAGIEYDFICPTGAHCGDVFTMQDYFWNPLTDDGDALRLVVKLGMDLTLFYKSEPQGALVNISLEMLSENGGDQYAATRRAIVRAAAEIGRGME
jgi:hypothetical protein